MPEKPAELEGKYVEYVFDSEDKFEITYDKLLEIIGKARLAGPQLIPVVGTVGELNEIKKQKSIIFFVLCAGATFYLIALLLQCSLQHLAGQDANHISAFGSILSGVATFFAAFVAAYLFNDWKEQETIIFKRNLAYTIFNDMVLLLSMMMDPKNEQYTVSSLQSQFRKILYDIVLYSKNESKAKALIEEFGAIYTRQLGVFETQKEGKTSVQVKDHLRFLNEYNTILHTCSELVKINISSEDIDVILKVMGLSLANSSDLESIKQNTNRMIKKIINKSFNNSFSSFFYNLALI